MTIVIRFFVFLLPWVTYAQLPGEKVYEEVGDGSSIVLYLVGPSNGFPEYYRGDVFTSVCKNEECPPVRIIFFWDLLGNFDHFELPPNEFLTKINQQPFDEEDYKKLDRILGDRNSWLGDLDINQLSLSLNGPIEAIDGISGATAKEMKSSMIEGAFFTCHTLWTIVNGKLVRAIEENTESIETEEFIKHMLSHDKYSYQRFAINRIVFLKEIVAWAPVLFEKLGDGSVFLDNHLLNSLPDEFLRESDAQLNLWTKFSELDYRNQLLLTRRFINISVEQRVSGIVADLINGDGSRLDNNLSRIYLNSEELTDRKIAFAKQYLRNDEIYPDPGTLELIGPLSKENRKLLKLYNRKTAPK